MWMRDFSLTEMALVVVVELGRPVQTPVLSETAGKGVHRRLAIERQTKGRESKLHEPKPGAPTLETPFTTT
jgi:hypothetical protein